VTVAPLADDGVPAVLRELRTVRDFETRCRQLLPPSVFESLFGQYGDPDWTALTSNLAGFESVKLRPRVLTGSRDRSLRTSVLGVDIDFPVLVGPTGSVDALDVGGQLPSLLAAGSAGTISVNPCLSELPLRQVASHARGPFWAQLWVFEDRAVTEFLVREAEAAGAAAIVVTVSNAGAPYWRTDRGGPRPPAWGSYRDEPAAALEGYPHGRTPTRRELNLSVDSGAAWADIDRIRELTSVPVVVKGIQTAEDAELARAHGVAGVVVSNHGGRFLQATRGTIESLPEVVAAVSGAAEVYLDGGVRQGTDVLAALALGARAVLIGRAALWGLIAGGEAGVLRVLRILAYELDAAMGLCGVHDVRGIPRELVYPGSARPPANKHSG
jgi:4-hydroxymandelate oxidase